MARTLPMPGRTAAFAEARTPRGRGLTSLHGVSLCLTARAQAEQCEDLIAFLSRMPRKRTPPPRGAPPRFRCLWGELQAHSGGESRDPGMRWSSAFKGASLLISINR